MKAVIASKKLSEKTSLFYTYCDFSHLLRVLSGLWDFSDSAPYVPVQQYGQLISRFSGMALYQLWWDIIPCLYDGYYGLNGKTYYNLGYCMGDFSSQLFDALF